MATVNPISSTGVQTPLTQEREETSKPHQKQPIDVFLIAQTGSSDHSIGMYTVIELNADTDFDGIKFARGTQVFLYGNGHVKKGILAQSHFFKIGDQVIELKSKTAVEFDVRGNLVKYVVPEGPASASQAKLESSPNWPAIGSLGGGVVALGSAVILGIMAQSEWNQFNKEWEAGNTDVHYLASLRDTAKLHAALANTLYAVGGVLVLTSGALFYFEVKF